MTGNFTSIKPGRLKLPELAAVKSQEPSYRLPGKTTGGFLTDATWKKPLSFLVFRENEIWKRGSALWLTNAGGGVIITHANTL